MSDNYESVSKTLSNIRSLRVFARELNNFTLLCEIREKLTAVIEEMREDAERLEREQQERDARKAELLKMIDEAGFSVAELAGVSGAGADKAVRKTRTVQPVPAKYQYELDGETKYWTGRGRKPKPIEDGIQAGKTLDDFLIPDAP